MRTRTAVATAVLLSLLVPAVPAAAAPRAGATVAVGGRVLDETGRGVPGATVSVDYTVTRTRQTGSGEALGDALSSLFRGLVCAFSFGFACRDDESRTTTTTRRITLHARTDRSGRYVLRYDRDWLPESGTGPAVAVTRRPLLRHTVPPRTTTTVDYRGGTTMPALHLWLRGASLEPVSATRRRLSAPVPQAMGRPVHPPRVVLVQGTGTAWGYGDVPRARTVDARVAEAGTTGTQTTVTTKIGSRTVRYRSGVRPVRKTVRPLSRGMRCYAYGLVTSPQLPGCPATDGRLGGDGMAFQGNRLVVDLGELREPDAYIVRGCPVLAVAGSVEGTVFLAVEVQQKEHRVYTGAPPVPVRYVRLDLGGPCDPREVSVFGAPMSLLPAGAYSGLQ